MSEQAMEQVVNRLALMYAKANQFSETELAAINLRVEEIHQGQKEFASRNWVCELRDLYWEVCAYVRDRYFVRPKVFTQREYARYMMQWWDNLKQGRDADNA